MWFLGEEIRNVNPIDTIVNDKSSKFTSYELSRGKEKKSLFSRANLFVPIKVSFNLSAQKRSL